MKKLLALALGALLAWPAVVYAAPAEFRVVPGCGGQSYIVGSSGQATGLATGEPCPPAPSSGASDAIAPIFSSALETSHVMCAAACNLYGLSVYIGATSGHIMLLNLAADPGNGTVAPALTPYPVTSNGTNGLVSATFDPPLRLSVGLVIVFSTTCCFTETQSATAFFSAQVK